MNALAEEHGLPRRLSGAGRVRQRLEVLELVQPGRPAARPGRALADRRHHAPGHARLRGRPGARLCRRALGRRRGRRHHGHDLPRSLRRGRRAFRPRLRRRQRPPLRVRRHAARASRAGAIRQRAVGSRQLVPTIVFHGDRDSTVHPRNGDQVIAQSTRAATGTCGPGCSAARCPAGMPTAARCTPTRAGSRPRAVGDPRRRPCLVGRQPGRLLHRPARARRGPRDAPLLPRAPSPDTARLTEMALWPRCGNIFAVPRVGKDPALHICPSRSLGSADRAIAVAGRGSREATQHMPLIGFHASHEQIDPRSLLAAVQAAEAAGFQAAMCSDHFSPWSARQGESGFAWSWLGAALQATSLSFGVVNAPGQRYHPAIIAQAAATLAQMFPDRFWVALGSGEAMNEHITGERWPVKSVRNARLGECVDIMRALFAGETVSHQGLVQVDRARLWTLPDDAAAFDRRRGQRGDGGLGRRLGRRSGHDQPAKGQARADDRGLSRERRRGQASLPADPCRLRPRRGGGACHRV